MYLASVILLVMYSLAGFIGMAMYALLGRCDPLSGGKVESYDQVIYNNFIECIIKETNHNTELFSCAPFRMKWSDVRLNPSKHKTLV